MAGIVVYSATELNVLYKVLLLFKIALRSFSIDFFKLFVHVGQQANRMVSFIELWIPFLLIGMTLATFKASGQIPVCGKHRIKEAAQRLDNTDES